MSDEVVGSPSRGAPQLTPEAVEQLIALHERMEQAAKNPLRRGGRFSASVHKHDWTPRQAQLNGARGDLRTALHVFRGTERKLREVREEHERSITLLADVRARIQTLDTDLEPPIMVTGVQHSGTSWVARVMDSLDGWHGHHELGKPARTHWLAQPGRYFEADSRLKDYLKKLWRVYPDVRIVHLVRDPRKVVRSLRNGVGVTFEIACERWADGVKKCETLPAVRLEDLLDNRRSFSEVFGAEIDAEAHARWSDTKVGASPEHKAPPFEEWPDDQKAHLLDVCGEGMRQHGYA